MQRVIFDEERCKGCGLCQEACPKGLISMASRINTKGFHPATVQDASQCTGCALCARMCPDVAIEVYR
ncbi:2-oxoglutarate ferredoxin oxidoreductase, delta subunit [Thermanaeromonas toyohensis ToBE]|uniref:2-oxoglutarate ferredoxin oxidoreductase, delta subunit n=1 Tax=Thermanaeromonas toyohensis ToBE TaxID=698762 RepID=A0A1W1V6M0_9FIRM|nr:4Fe-4S binding protein [Thermanaeromonas toyohensis]SMB88701.1 2-oxoglutarate ferredoxin oxidoreductase, delta subunit [Thermanaeromonas toyohensis ToBE]